MTNNPVLVRIYYHSASLGIIGCSEPVTREVAEARIDKMLRETPGLIFQIGPVDYHEYTPNPAATDKPVQS
jgi:hypothetical protein